MSDYWVLNRNEGQDTVHKNPREVCNTDDADGRETIDAATGKGLIANGSARACEHCRPLEED